MKHIKYINKHLEEYALMILLMLMVGIMGAQVFARHIFNYSLSWSEELTRFLFIWSAFLSIGLCIKNETAIKVDQLLKIFKKNSLMRIFVIVCYLIELIFFLYMLPFAWQYFKDSFVAGQRSPASNIPMYFIHAAPMVGFTLAVYRLIQKLIIKLSKI